MASDPISNHNPLTSERDRSKRKKKKRQQQQLHHHFSSDSERQNHAKWQTEAQQQIYSSKLIKALSQVRLSPPSSSAPRPGRAVREAADRALAFSAKGKTRWSRAILTSRIKIKFRKHNKRQKISAFSSSSALITGNNRSSKKHRISVLRLKKKSLPSVQRKVRVLGRLVPGCRKQPLPVILEEATDYIAALEMQVRAMSALADLLSGPTSSSGSGSISGPPRS